MTKQTNILEIEKQSFEFDSSIKTKYIDEWASVIFNLVLLENGDVYTIIKKGVANKYIMGDKIDEKCTYLDFIADPNNITPIFKTNNNLHYFIRHTDDIDNKRIDINLYHKSVPLTDECKDNTIIPYYAYRTYSKKYDVYNLNYLATTIKYDKKFKTTQLIATDDDYILFDYKNKTIQFRIDDNILKLTLEGYSEDTDVLRTLKFNGHFGYKQITYKKDSNYILIRSNGKGAIVLFLQNDIDKNKFDFIKEFEFYDDKKRNFVKGLEYLEQTDNYGYDLFADKHLPNLIEYDSHYKYDKRNSDEVIIFTYLDKKEKVIIPKNPYGRDAEVEII